MAAAVAAYGGIDILVANAGIVRVSDSQILRLIFCGKQADVMTISWTSCALGVSSEFTSSVVLFRACFD